MKILLTTLLIITHLTNSQCPSKDPYCGACNGSFCQTCYGAALNYQGRCQKVQTQSNCMQYNQNATCRFCTPGFAVTNRGSCLPIPIKDCAELSGNKCVMCLNGILIQGGQCDARYKCSSNCRACQVNNGRESCARCDTGYALKMYSSGNKCVLETAKNSNCLYLNGSGGCAVCDVNYYWKNGFCERSTVQGLKLYGELVSGFLWFFVLLLNL